MFAGITRRTNRYSCLRKDLRLCDISYIIVVQRYRGNACDSSSVSTAAAAADGGYSLYEHIVRRRTNTEWR